MVRLNKGKIDFHLYIVLCRWPQRYFAGSLCHSRLQVTGYLCGLDDDLEVLASEKIDAPIYRLIFCGHQVSSFCILPIALLVHSV